MSCKSQNRKNGFFFANLKIEKKNGNFMNFSKLKQWKFRIFLENMKILIFVLLKISKY